MGEGPLVGEYIKFLRMSAELTQRELDHAAGFSTGTIGQYETGAKGRRRPGREVLNKIAAALHITGTVEHQRLLEIGGHLRRGEKLDTPNRPSFEVFLRGDAHLTPEQRRVLVETYHLFVRTNRGEQR